MKKIVALLICILTIFSLLGTTVSAAGKVKLSKTSITLEVGETASLSLLNATGKIKWKISNGKVCKFSKGTVTAVGEGTATITAENKNRKYKCTVTVTDSSSDETDSHDSDGSISIGVGEKAYLDIKADYTSRLMISYDNSDVIGLGTKIKDNILTITIKGKQKGVSYITVYDKNSADDGITIKVRVGKQSEAAYSESNDAEESVSAEDYIDEVIRLVNKEREEAGLDPLEKSSTLCKNAAVRVSEIAGYFSHTRPDGSECFTAITIRYTAAGENIAQGQRDPEQVMDSWMNSDGHRRNILSSKFTKIGVGYDPDTNSWVQIFAG